MLHAGRQGWCALHAAGLGTLPRGCSQFALCCRPTRVGRVTPSSCISRRLPMATCTSTPLPAALAVEQSMLPASLRAGRLCSDAKESQTISWGVPGWHAPSSLPLELLPRLLRWLLPLLSWLVIDRRCVLGVSRGGSITTQRMPPPGMACMSLAGGSQPTSCAASGASAGFAAWSSCSNRHQGGCRCKFCPGTIPGHAKSWCAGCWGTAYIYYQPRK